MQDTDSGELEALKSREILEEQVARQRQIIDHYESFVELLTREPSAGATIDNPFVSDKTPASAYDPPENIFAPLFTAINNVVQTPQYQPIGATPRFPSRSRVRVPFTARIENQR